MDGNKIIDPTISVTITTVTNGPSKSVANKAKNKMIAMSHSENHLKRLIGSAANDEVAYQAAAGTETCWRWCLLRSNLYKMPESRFKKLFYRLDASVKSPDDLCSLITLGMLGPGYMAQALRSDGNRP